MANNTYDIGDVVRITGSFTQDGSALDPTTVSLIVREPDGTLTTYVYLTDAALVRSALGSYSLDFATTQAGQHWYRWVTTGTGASAEESWFAVRKTQAS